MKFIYTIRPKRTEGFSSFSVVASEARKALEIANVLIERGIESVEILDGNGTSYDLAELRRTVDKGEGA